MLIAITGFLADASEDDSIKLKIHVKHEFEHAVMTLMGWECLKTSHAGTPLTSFKAQQISKLIQEPIPEKLDLYIGVRLSEEEVAEATKEKSDEVFISISGFYSASNPDDSLQYDRNVPQELELEVLAVMGWVSLRDVPPGEHDLAKNEAMEIMKILGDPFGDDLVYCLGLCV